MFKKKLSKKYSCLILDDIKSLSRIISIISLDNKTIEFIGAGSINISDIEFHLVRLQEDYFYNIYHNGMPDLIILDNDLGEDLKEGQAILKETINNFDCSNLKGFISCSLNTPARENMISYFSCWLKHKNTTL